MESKVPWGDESADIPPSRMWNVQKKQATDLPVELDVMERNNEPTISKTNGGSALIFL